MVSQARFSNTGRLVSLRPDREPKVGKKLMQPTWRPPWPKSDLQRKRVTYEKFAC